MRQAQLAEASGFDFVEISDHYHPWLDSQGHSPFAWTVLGAIAASTDTIGLATGVTCPTIRYHPASTVLTATGDRNAQNRVPSSPIPMSGPEFMPDVPPFAELP